MKKLVLGVVVLVVFLVSVSGCNYERYNITEEERAILLTFDNNPHFYDAPSSYKALLNMLRGVDRDLKSHQGEEPFFDLHKVILMDEQYMHKLPDSEGTKVDFNNMNISSILKDVYGISVRNKSTSSLKSKTAEDLIDGLPTLMFTDNKNPVTVTKKEQITKVIEDSVVVRGKSLLSPAKVRELRVSAKECNRTKNKLLEITEDTEYLTTKDYDNVIELILDCENLKLQIELNS